MCTWGHSLEKTGKPGDEATWGMQRSVPKNPCPCSLMEMHSFSGIHKPADKALHH